jgi:uncharacterized protein (DUF427 family)
MAVRLSDTLLEAMSQLRVEPTPKRVRAMLDGQTVVDTTRALLVWEPQRVVPGYAVPIADLAGELVPAAPIDRAQTIPLVTLQAGGPRVIESADFALHTTDGEDLTLRLAGAELVGAAFRASDPDLDGYVLLDWDAFDRWLEEEEEVRGHPRDPFHRVDVRLSSRHVRIELDGELVAESSRPRLVFETKLAPRFYLPREDVVAALEPSPTRTICAYKGEAGYFSLRAGGRTMTDIAWSYEAPLPDAAELASYVSFYDERVDVRLDGELRERPQSPWSPAPPEVG